MFDLNKKSSVEKQFPLIPPKDASPPPSYSALPPDITASFSSLSLGRGTAKPTRDQCVAHLKLLECFHELRENVATNDGLFGIRDRFAEEIHDPKARAEFLLKTHEKRWAVYVAKAAERFEAWWQYAIEISGKMQRLQDISQLSATINNARPFGPMKDSLPPIDVLMVWHTFMLNPRNYLEDCIRFDKLRLWTTGFPWEAVNACIDNETFEYSPSAEARQEFESKTRHAWDSLHDSPTISVACPKCRKMIPCPWTTCDSGPWMFRNTGDSGYGFADKAFEAQCTHCNTRTNHDVRRAMKLRRDVKLLKSHAYPMPGTFLDKNGRFGKETAWTVDRIPEHFPNRLINEGGVHVELLSATDPATHGKRLFLETNLTRIVSLEGVRNVLEDALKDKTKVKRANGTFRAVLLKDERISVRRLMSRYWDNSSIFSLDLVGAVIRQGTFIEKMHAIDWIHSPALSSTMDRLLIKYRRYFDILAKHKDQIAVPTLDVDLAWHTHQLAPKSYYDYSTAKTDIFIDHDDKIDENKLSDAFEWTSKTYQKMFNEVYSECTCWYCESVRESHTPALSLVIKNKAIEKDLDRLHATATTDDPHKGPHISAHNAIQVTGDSDQLMKMENKAYELERNYQKACKHAKKRGRTPPGRDGYMSTYAYGYPVVMPYYAPYMGDPCVTNGMYAGNPGCANVAPGTAGNCAAGSCGGMVAAGACGGAGGACAGGSVGGCGGGGGFGGGGGCGGGGGGCGGGGGGGGGGGCGGGGGGGGGC